MSLKIIFILYIAAFSKSALAASCLNCNVVLVSLDTVGAKHVGVYGAGQDTTPNIDAFAKKARVYSNAYSTASWTLPAHVSMLTGRFPWSVGVLSPTEAILPETSTLAKILQDGKYETAAFVGGVYLSPAYGFNQGFDSFNVVGSKSFFEKNFSKSVDQAIAWMRKPRKKPFFLFLHTYDVHAPYTPSRSSIAAMGGDVKSPTLTLERIVKYVKNKPTQSDVAQSHSLYRAGIRDVDQILSGLFTFLEKQGLQHNTIVIITSDHGEELNEHGSLALHGFTLYNEVLNVPLIVSMPNIPAKKIESPVSLVDVVPTVLSAVGLKSPTPLHGQVLPEVDTPKSRERTVFASASIVLENLIAAFSSLQNVTPVPQRPGVAPRPVGLSWTDPTIPKSTRFAMISLTDKLIVDLGKMKQVGFNLIKDSAEKSPAENLCKDIVCKMQLDFILKAGVTDE